MFELTVEQQTKVDSWAAEIDARVAKQQFEEGGDAAMWTDGGKYPYYGAIGGELTYSFTPTSLGMVVAVKHSREEKPLDVTEYDSW